MAWSIVYLKHRILSIVYLKKIIGQNLYTLICCAYVDSTQELDIKWGKLGYTMLVMGIKQD